jgi:hypothetical protein
VREHGRELADVAHQHAQPGQQPAESQQQREEARQHHREGERAQVRAAVEQRVADEPDGHADQCMETRYQGHHPRQHLQREDHLLHVVRIGGDQQRRLGEAFGECVVDDQAGEQHERVVAGAAGESPARLEDHAEGDGVYRQQEHRLRERPGDAAERALVAAGKLATRQLEHQRPVAPQWPDHAGSLAAGGRRGAQPGTAATRPYLSSKRTMSSSPR